MKDRKNPQFPDKAVIKEIDQWLQYAANRREYVRGGVLAMAFALGLIPRVSGKTASKDRSGKSGSGKLPQVTLGGTDAKVSLLGVGTQTLGENLDRLDDRDLEKTAVDVFNHAIDNGVTYFDTASGYKRAEEFLGKTLQGKDREKFFLVTKVWTNSYNAAKQAFERSLRRLGTDYIDLLHIHDAGMRDMDKVLRQPSDKGYDPQEHGAWKYLEEQKQAGRVRFLGVTAHSGPEQFAQLINHTHDQSNEREKVDSVMVRFSYVSHNWHGFHNQIPPLVEKYNMGAMIMKVFGGPTGFGRELNERELKEAVRYARGYDWGHGCVIGCSSKTQIDRNMAWVQEKPMKDSEMAKLRSLAMATNDIWKQRFAQRVAERYC